MNKTITVTLNGVVFALEEDAYEVLKKYLEDIKRHFAADEERDELARDIEASIAEKFSEIIKGSKSVITLADVDKLIAELGRVDEIAEEAPLEGEASAKASAKASAVSGEYKIGRKLYRNPDDQIIAGVCSGLAAFFGVDPVIVRLLFVVSIFFGGFGVIMYLILWLIMPEAKTTAQKLEMKGDPVNLKKLEELAREKTEVIREKTQDGSFKRVLSLPFQFLGQLFKGMTGLFAKLFPVLGAVIGVFIIIGAIVGLIALTITAFACLMGVNGDWIHSDIPLNEVFSRFSFALTVTCAYFIALIPVVYVLLLGTVLVRRKSVLTPRANIFLIGAWMAAVIFFGVIMVDVAPRAQTAIQEYEAAHMVEKEFDLKDFDRIYMTGSHLARITPGPEFKITASGREQDFARLDLEVDRSQLQVSNRHDNGFCLFCTRRGLEFDITMPELIEVRGTGSSEVSAQGFSPDTMRLLLNASARADLNTGAPRVAADISGTAWLSLTGSSTILEADLSGASKLNAENLVLQTLTLAVSGSSRAELSGQAKEAGIEAADIGKVYAFPLLVDKAVVKAANAAQVEIEVAEEIDINASGASQIYYRGDPAVTGDSSKASQVQNVSLFWPDN